MMATISRQLGAGGDEIARKLAAELGWRLLDNSVVESLLMERGFSQTAFGIFNERRPDLWHRISTEKERYLHFLKLVSYGFARRGNCVVLGRGGQVLFGSVPGIIRVRVVAPLECRVQRVKEASGGDEQRARQLVLQSDNERTGFYRFLLHTDWDCPDLYELIVNSQFISSRTVVDLILKALDSQEVAGKKGAALGELEQLYLVQKAVIAILFEQKLPIQSLEIEVSDGTVTLKGTAQDHPSIERCGETAAGVFGKKTIHNEISFAPRFVEMLGGIHHDAPVGAARSEN